MSWDPTPANTAGGNDQWGGGAENADWNDGPSAENNHNGGFGDGDAGGACTSCGQTDHAIDACPNGANAEFGAPGGDDKCFGCGEAGHRRAECPSAGEMTCRFCKQPGHMVKDCPDKPPMSCDNCGEDGHMKWTCENARKVNRDHIADVSPETAWAKIVQAVSERDLDDAKEGVQEYVKSLNGAVTYRELQAALLEQSVNLWLIATERQLINIFTNMDLQGNTGKKYSISYRFSDKPERPREIEGWPASQDEILERLNDAGEVVDSGLSKCRNCGELGHIAKTCPEEAVEKPQVNKTCYNCGVDGHRVRDCPEPRVDKFACKNCGKSGHRVADCEEPTNLDNIECRKCNEMGHFSKDCPQGGGNNCRNCGQEGHIAKECDQPRNMDTVTCRNCEKTGHFSRECPEPKDWSKVQCSNCQEFGHTKVRCKQPPTETDGFDDGGFNNAADSNAAAPAGGDDWGTTTAPAVAVSSGGW